MANVLFVCLHNAGRSQMSRALFVQTASQRHSGEAAGTQPAEKLHPTVVEAMEEIGVDVSGRRPQLLTREMAEWADVVVTMGCGDECPYIPGKRYLDWGLQDPKDMTIEEVRELRDDISDRVDALLVELEGPEHKRPANAGSGRQGDFR
ncbi:MAG: heat-shock protein HtpX [Solirubrobacterales bacterium 70-9]|nr:MAG: heat-shock protein HtpX [Solirubrobacterales bacterium 70-9]